MATRRTRGFALEGPFSPESGCCWVALAPADFGASDSGDEPQRSRLLLYEDDEPLGPAHAAHDEIRSRGLGQFSHWENELYFSTSDNSDPNANGRRYRIGFPDARGIHPLDRTQRALVEVAADLIQDSEALEVEAVREGLRLVLQTGQEAAIDELERRIPIRGLRLLEVGCGSCWHAPFFLTRGAAGYCGLDPGLESDSRKIPRRDADVVACHHPYVEMPLALGPFLNSFRDIEIQRCDVERAPWAAGSFDLIFAFNVTEHFVNPRAAFRAMHRLLRPGGRIYLAHHNYYCWNGHHFPPSTVAEYDDENPAMRQVADWNHVRNPVGFDDPQQVTLNFLRLHEFVEFVSDLFELESVETTRSSPATGGERLTPAIRAALPQHSEEELLTDMVYVTGRRRELRTDDPLPGEHHASLELCAVELDADSCWRAEIPRIADPCELVLLEDGHELHPAGVTRPEIRRKGAGRYLVWGTTLFFSSSDGSDPTANGRRYVLRDRRQETGRSRQASARSADE